MYILPNIGATLSLILGFFAIFWPSKIETIVSIKGVGKEGKSEVRATYGGFFVGILRIPPHWAAVGSALQ